MKWQDSTLGKLIEEDGGVLQTGPFGSQLHQADYQPEGIPVIMPKDIADGHVSAESVARISEETASRLARHKLKARSIVLPRRGEITKRAFIRPEQQGWLCGTGCLKIELTGKEVVPEFLYYFMEQSHVVQWLEQHAVGTTMLNLSAGIVAGLPIRYPMVQTQRRIADILSAYDDLIENNRRRMALLEKAARLLYEEWFVRLRFPGHHYTRIIDGVPDGWERASFPKIVDFLEGPGLRNHQYRDQGVPFLNIRTIKEDEIDLSKVQFIDEAEVQSRYQHFLLAEDDHVVSSSGTLGRVVTIRACHLPVMLNTSLIRMRPKLPRQKWFLKAFLKYGDFLEQVTAMATGAAQLNYGPSHLHQIKMTVPSRAVGSLFEDQATAMYEQIKTLLNLNLKLKAARDLVLPRLMSGEIAV